VRRLFLPLARPARILAVSLLPGCQSTCSTHLDCAADEYCSSGSCTAMGDLFRKPCTTVDECGEGYCISGYCYQIGETCTCDPRDPCTPTAAICADACTADSDCNDGNPCTDDRCLDRACRNTPKSEPGCCAVDTDCDDGNPCTTDACASWQCTHPIDPESGCCQTDLDCDDANPCTADTCGDDGACGHERIDPLCCTADDQCDDQDPCTEDFSGGTRCMAPRTVDSEICACAGDEACDDGNPCSVDRCIEARCTYDHDPQGLLPGATCCATDGMCGDGDGNTVDTCVHHVCRHELRVPCDKESDCFELDPCTLYTCVNGTCAVSSVLEGCCRDDLQCDDGDACTKDRCSNNLCRHDYAANPGCCETDAQCDDGVACTKDRCCLDAACDPGGATVGPFHCVHEAAGPNCCTTDAECTDDNWCTLDTCAGNTCTHTPKADCCYFQEDCDDDVWCTEDVCDEGTCTHTKQSGCCYDESECDDGNPCTDDYCLNHLCQHQARASCCTSDAQCTHVDPCVQGSCVNQACVYAPKPGCCKVGDSCDDGDSCTKDQCVGNQCVHTADPNPSCCEPTIVGEAHFDGGDALTWDLQNSSTQVGWVIDSSGPATSGAGALRYHGASGGYLTPGNPNSGTAMSTPITIPWEPNVALGFQLYSDIRPWADVDKLSLSVHDGTQFVKVWDKTMLDEGVAGSYQQVWITTDTLQGKTVRLKFEFDTVDADVGSHTGVAIDDVTVGYGCKVGTVTCVAPSDCADDNPCTIDFCLPDGTCTHNAGNEGIRCAEGKTCQAGVCAAAGCILEECDDGDPCMIASCESGTCERTPVEDGGACFLSGAAAGFKSGACQAGTCVPKTCSEAACGAADDPCLAATCPDGPLGACGALMPTNEGMPCDEDGAVCQNGACVKGACTAAGCNDMDPCTEDSCDGDDCKHEAMPVGTPCGDGGVCMGGAASCSAPIRDGEVGVDYDAGETACNGLDDNFDGKIDEGGVCPYPVHQFAGPETILEGGKFTGGHAYMFLTDSVSPQMDWFEARAACEVYGYHLVFINSPAEGQFVHEWINNDTDAFGYITADTWIGARLAPESSEWGWQDDIDPWGYEDFSGFVFNPGDSYNYDNYGACAYFGDHEKTHWDVSPCSYDRSVVCESGPTTPPGLPFEPTDYIRGKCYYDYDGNQYFGAGYAICAFVQMNEGAQPGDLPSYLRAYAGAKGFARVFSKDYTILGVRAEAEATNTTAFAEAALTVLGADVFSLRVAAELEIDPLFSLDVTFLEVSTTFAIGYVPVTLSAALEGSIGIKLLATAGLGGIALTPTPFATVQVSATAGVGIKGVEIGLQISLELIGLDIPIEIDLILPTWKRLDWEVIIDLDVHTLDGEVAIVLEIGPIEITFTLFEWEGFHWVFRLYDKAGSIDL